MWKRPPGRRCAHWCMQDTRPAIQGEVAAHLVREASMHGSTASRAPSLYSMTLMATAVSFQRPWNTCANDPRPRRFPILMSCSHKFTWYCEVWLSRSDWKVSAQALFVIHGGLWSEEATPLTVPCSTTHAGHDVHGDLWNRKRTKDGPLHSAHVEAGTRRRLHGDTRCKRACR